MKNDSNLFYTCSLIEYMSRQKKLRRSETVKKLGIKATFVVVTFMLTEESRQKYKDHMKKTATLGDLTDTSKQPKLSDLTPEEHGPLIEINYSHSSHGMAMGSGSSSSEKIV